MLRALEPPGANVEPSFFESAQPAEAGFTAVKATSVIVSKGTRIYFFNLSLLRYFLRVDNSLLNDELATLETSFV